MSIKRHSKTSAAFSEKEIFGDKRIVSDIDLGILQMQMLWLLSRKSSHGYDLMKNLNKIKSSKITQGTLYPTLNKLVNHGLVKREKVGRKIVYHVTDKGSTTMKTTCIDFCRTFYGIYQDFVCRECLKRKT